MGCITHVYQQWNESVLNIRTCRGSCISRCPPLKGSPAYLGPLYSAPTIEVMGSFCLEGVLIEVPLDQCAVATQPECQQHHCCCQLLHELVTPCVPSVSSVWCIIPAPCGTSVSGQWQIQGLKRGGFHVHVHSSNHTPF